MQSNRYSTDEYNIIASETGNTVNTGTQDIIQLLTGEQYHHLLDVIETGSFSRVKNELRYYINKLADLYLHMLNEKL